MTLFGISIAKLASEVGGEAVGETSITVRRPAEPARARADEIALAVDPKFLSKLSNGQARTAILPVGTDWQSLGLEAAILVTSAREAMVGLSVAMEVPWARAWGNILVHDSAIIHPSAKIGEGVAIGPFCVIGPEVHIGDHTIIHDHVTIAQDVVIGASSQIYAGVRIGPQVQIGEDVIIMANSVVGADGFSYQTPNADAIRAARSEGTAGKTSSANILRINSLGTVELHDRVEIGAGCTIDRGTLNNTIIGAGTKLDNMVHIAHNVEVGENCLLCAQVGIAGSTTVGDGTILGGQVGVSDHISVGAGVMAMGKSALSSNVPAGQTVMGSPAIKMSSNIESYKAYRRLPRLFARVKQLEEWIESQMGSKDKTDG